MNDQSRIAIHESMAARSAAGAALVDDAERLARACHAMAVRFHRGGKLLVFGSGGCSTDAQHVAVEFVHPVIVGKRALPALALCNDIAAVTGSADGSAFANQLRRLATPSDIAMGISADGEGSNLVAAFEAAREIGLLTIALCGDGGGAVARRRELVDWCLPVHSTNRLIVKEVQVTMYHILWELVHVFFDQPGVLDAAVTKR